MSNEASKAAGKAAAEKPAAKPQSDAGAGAREYVVYREMEAADLVEQLSREGGHLEDDAIVLVRLGSAEAKSAKEARRTVAKAKLSEDELRTEQGVSLNAIAKTAATAGRGVARLKVEPVWAD